MGRSGDSDVQVTGLELLFEEVAGDPLSSAEANALVDTLRVYLDDGDETFVILPGETSDGVIVTAFGLRQEFDGVSSIFADAGDGSDTITVTGYLVTQ